MNSRIACFLIFSILSYNTNTKKETIFLGIDSLTEGARGTTYSDFFYKDSMPPKPSYISIDYKSTKDVEIAVFMTENMKWFNPELAYSS